jgi:hypothetical protein
MIIKPFAPPDALSAASKPAGTLRKALASDVSVVARRVGKKWLELE